jgi:hypothetical protein
MDFFFVFCRWFEIMSSGLRLWRLAKESAPVMTMLGIVIGGHIGWKYLQTIEGFGEQGREYPHKTVSHFTNSQFKKVYVVKLLHNLGSVIAILELVFLELTILE